MRDPKIHSKVLRIRQTVVGNALDAATRVYDGRIYTLKTCQSCAELEGEAWGWAGESDDGYGPQDFIESVTEHRDTDPRAAALLARLNV